MDATVKEGPDRLQLPLHVDVQPLLAELQGLPESAWVDHFVRDNYEGRWRILPLRGPAGETHPIRLASTHPGQTAFGSAPILETLPAFKSLLARFQCPLQSVRVMALEPGSSIREHRDPDLDGAGGVVRLHVPLATHPDVRFLLNGAAVPFEVGTCWYLRLSDPHAVENASGASRIHLVLDVELNAWLEARLALPDPGGRILAFLDRLGLVWKLQDLPGSTFLPGLHIEAGCLHVDPHRLLHPGDLLHEAGHLAVVDGDLRSTLGPGGLEDPGLEMAAIAWSYAACLELGLPLEVLFHNGGYKADAPMLRALYSSGGVMGQPLLVWMGLTTLDPAQGPVFPAMRRWLRT